MLVNLSNVRTSTLAWDLPVGDCRVRWRGANLVFDYWGVPTETRPQTAYGGPQQDRDRRCVDLAATPVSNTPTAQDIAGCSIAETDFLDGVQAWRFQQDRPSSDFLVQLADYLEQRGRLWDSLDRRADGKALLFQQAEPAVDFALADAGPLAALDRFVRWAFGEAMHVTGYGVKPHRVLAALLAVWAGGVIIYAIVGWRWKDAWPSIRDGVPGDGHEVASHVPGFMQFDDKARPQRFSVLGYSLDATLPVVDLQMFNKYYPKDAAVQVVAKAQRCAGWLLLTVLLASAAVL